jgi:hypothetical protein
VSGTEHPGHVIRTAAAKATFVLVSAGSARTASSSLLARGRGTGGRSWLGLLETGADCAGEQVTGRSLLSLCLRHGKSLHSPWEEVFLSAAQGLQNLFPFVPQALNGQFPAPSSRVWRHLFLSLSRKAFMVAQSEPIVLLGTCESSATERRARVAQFLGPK